ncbi:hypothetical protein NPIL_446911 [Nephila pilipes]|uniref:Uncharacterized protein n=1 Tax=Nephila pilipes TaxID=299642 RepID=A0A8X6UVW6_NEPPI|nr:hypothetical protein NPIL_446911 [Nephila pilipes]
MNWHTKRMPLIQVRIRNVSILTIQVYAYQGVPLSSTSLNNTGTKHIHNDLGMKSNLNKTKLGDEESDTYACSEQENQIGTRD